MPVRPLLPRTAEPFEDRAPAEDCEGNEKVGCACAGGPIFLRHGGLDQRERPADEARSWAEDYKLWRSDLHALIDDVRSLFRRR